MIWGIMFTHRRTCTIKNLVIDKQDLLHLHVLNFSDLLSGHSQSHTITCVGVVFKMMLLLQLANGFFREVYAVQSRKNRGGHCSQSK